MTIVDRFKATASKFIQGPTGADGAIGLAGNDAVGFPGTPPRRVRRAQKPAKYLHLQGSAARKFKKFSTVVDGKRHMKIPNWMLAVAGNSPLALSYLMRRDLTPGSVSTFKKIDRARNIALAQAGDSFVVHKLAGV